MGSWYETGFDGAQREQEKRELGYGPNRLWQKPGASRELIFLDDLPFCIWEHAWKNESGKWEFATCINKIATEGCPADGAKGVQGAEYTGFLTVVDGTGYVDGKGRDHKWELIMLTPKTKVINRIKKKKESRGSLVGCMYTLTRADENTPSTGDDLDFIREGDMNKLYAVVSYKGKNLKQMIDTANAGAAEGLKVRKYLSHHFQIPAEGPIPEKIPTFNYAELLVPLGADELRSLVANAQGFKNSKFGGGGGGSGGARGAAGPSGASSDDVPF